MGNGVEMNERRRKLIPVSRFLMQQAWAHTGEVIHVKCTDGLPADATLISLTYDHMRDVYFFCYQSSEWEEVPDYEMLPTFVPTFTNLYVGKLLEKAEQIIDTFYGKDANKWLEEYRTFKQQTGYPE